MLKNPKYVYGASDITVPVHLNCGQFILDKLQENANKGIAFINAITKESTTYRQIAQEAVNAALSLARMGVRRGDTVAICSENRPEFWGAFTGVACTGATVTLFNFTYTKGEMKHVLNISKPKIVICSPSAHQTHAKNFKDTGFVEKIIVFDSEAAAGAVSWRDLIQPAQAAACAQFEAAAVAGQQDPLCVLYSSGTTGLPKGVVLTHLNVIASLTSYGKFPMMLNLEEETFLTVVPWFHAMGLVGTLGYLVYGRRFVFLPKFELMLYLDIIEKYKIQKLTVVPPLLIALIKVKTDHDLSSVKDIFSGAAPLSKEILGSVNDRFPNVSKVLQGYGLTECTLAVTGTDTGSVKQGGVGGVVHGMVAKVVDIETRQALGPNQQGEICVKGPTIMKGYIGMDNKDYFDEEGFLRTGDIGFYDDDGCFFIVDRLKELIKYKGYQVAPAEIEAVLLQHEAVRDAGVVAAQCKGGGEVPLAFVVTQPGKAVTEKEIKDFVAERLSNPKHLRGGVRFVKEIPKNPSGKILRRQLKEWVKQPTSKL